MVEDFTSYYSYEASVKNIIYLFIQSFCSMLLLLLTLYRYSVDRNVFITLENFRKKQTIEGQIPNRTISVKETVKAILIKLCILIGFCSFWLSLSFS